MQYDIAVLTSRYFPRRLIKREEIINRLNEAIHLGFNVYVEGKNGVGKTTLLLWLNGQHEGFYKEIDEMDVWRRLAVALPSTPKVYYIDNIDRLGRFSNIVKFLSALYRKKGDSRAAIITSNIQWLKFKARLNDYPSYGLLSRYQFVPMALPGYAVGELVTLMKDRLDALDFKEGKQYRINELRTLARFVAKEDSHDVRLALRTLRYALDHAETRLTEDDCNYAIGKAKQDYWNDKLLEMTPRASLMAYCVAKAIPEEKRMDENVPVDSILIKTEFQKVADFWGFKANEYQVETAIDELVRNHFLTNAKQEQRGQGYGVVTSYVFPKPIHILKSGNALAEAKYWEILSDEVKKLEGGETE